MCTEGPQEGVNTTERIASYIHGRAGAICMYVCVKCFFFTEAQRPIFF